MVIILSKKSIWAALIIIMVCMSACTSKASTDLISSTYSSDTASANELSAASADAAIESVQESGLGNLMGWNGVGVITDEAAYVSTPYGDMYYPVEYADLLNVDITEGDFYRVSFSGRSSVGDVFLFIINFGSEDHGEVIGTYEENGDTLAVTYQLCELNLDDRWSDDEKQQLEAEQTAVSAYVVENLTKLQGFTASE